MKCLLNRNKLFFYSATFRLLVQSNNAINVLLYASRLNKYRAAIRRIVWLTLPWRSENSVHPFFENKITPVSS